MKQTKNLERAALQVYNASERREEEDWLSFFRTNIYIYRSPTGQAKNAPSSVLIFLFLFLCSPLLFWWVVFLFFYSMFLFPSMRAYNKNITYQWSMNRMQKNTPYFQLCVPKNITSYQYINELNVKRKVWEKRNEKSTRVTTLEKSLRHNWRVKRTGGYFNTHLPLTHPQLRCSYQPRQVEFVQLALSCNMYTLGLCIDDASYNGQRCIGQHDAFEELAPRSKTKRFSEIPQRLTETDWTHTFFS